MKPGRSGGGGGVPGGGPIEHWSQGRPNLASSEFAEELGAVARWSGWSRFGFSIRESGVLPTSLGLLLQPLRILSR
jgi:hypothetical protein